MLTQGTYSAKPSDGRIKRFVAPCIAADIDHSIKRKSIATDARN